MDGQRRQVWASSTLRMLKIPIQLEKKDTMRERKYQGSRANLSKVKKLLVDGRYSGKPFAKEIKEILGAEIEVVKRNELHIFKVLPKRWIVERSFGWLEKCRRLWKNCERKLTTSRQMIILAFISLLARRN